LDEIHYRILRCIGQQPDVSQRQLAREMGVSLGKVNYCLRALIDKGWVKLHNFRGNPDKRAYAYLLTPEGMARKAQLTASFLQRKLAEYDSLKAQIAELREELESDSSR
jgi:EPS-associated MarR family transcriptional regulator